MNWLVCSRKAVKDIRLQTLEGVCYFNKLYRFISPESDTSFEIESLKKHFLTKRSQLQ